ncbi:MAG TPA: L,D-transpeptidase family protein [Solirubrobacteraceae bacterium]|nr:L,D-transpeptidase family protein [Solirubrobacteraceae bacterium]
MPSRRPLAPVVAVLAVLVVAAPAAAQDPGTTAPPPAPAPAPEPTIQPGVGAAGVDLSGLTVAQATQKLDAELRPRLEAPLVLVTGGRRWILSAKASKLKLDSERTAKRALYSQVASAQVPVAVSHSRPAVRAFLAEVRKRVARAPRNATARITLRRVRIRASRYGRTLPVEPAARTIDRALDDAVAAPREVRKPLVKVRAKINYNDARRLYYTVITVDKAHFRLRLFKNLRVVRSYGVAVGQPAYPTPSGLFRIVSKQVNPTWSVPNSPWAGELGGTTVAGGSAANPLKARWMGIVNGVGIHGTGEDWSIGQRASHGCIRMHVWDVVALYGRVPVGTPVLIR